jgi:predicted PurR-regulated permease PerM
LAAPSLSQSAAQAPTRDDPKEANMTQYAFSPVLKALGLRIVNSVYNVSLAASIAFVFLVFIAVILAMAIWGRVIELPEFHRSM